MIPDDSIVTDIACFGFEDNKKPDVIVISQDLMTDVIAGNDNAGKYLATLDDLHSTDFDIRANALNRLFTSELRVVYIQMR